jgi:hypothetical protein
MENWLVLEAVIKAPLIQGSKNIGKQRGMK